MPIYEYECSECGQRTELLQRFGDPPLASCPQCGGAVHKLFSAPAVQFKGSGWYVTDYAGKGKPAAESAGKEKKEAGDAKGDAAAGKAAAAKSTGPAASDTKSGGSAD